MTPGKVQHSAPACRRLIAVVGVVIKIFRSVLGDIVTSVTGIVHICIPQSCITVVYSGVEGKSVARFKPPFLAERCRKFQLRQCAFRFNAPAVIESEPTGMATRIIKEPAECGFCIVAYCERDIERRRFRSVACKQLYKAARKIGRKVGRGGFENHDVVNLSGRNKVERE